MLGAGPRSCGGPEVDVVVRDGAGLVRLEGASWFVEAPESVCCPFIPPDDAGGRLD